MLTTYDDVAAGADLELSADALVIGSGAGGAPFATSLAEAGWDGAILAEGAYVPTEESGHALPRAVRMLYRDGGATMALGAPPVIYQEGRCVGGSTTINGGMSWATPPRILEDWAARGIRAIDPKAMEPYFARAERDLSVATQDPDSIGIDAKLYAEGARKLGWKIIENRRNQKHCVGSSNCAFGCPTGAKQSTLVSYVPRARRAGARLYANFRADRLLLQGRRVVGAMGSVIDHYGRRKARFRVRARLTVLSCGAIQTPGLLYRSGVGSASGELGKHLKMHPNVKACIAMFDQEVRSWQGVHQAYQIREFHDEGIVPSMGSVPPGPIAMSLPGSADRIRRLMDRFAHMWCGGVLIEDEGEGAVHPGPGGKPIATYKLTRTDAEKLRRGCALVAETMFAAGAPPGVPPLPGGPDPESAAGIPKTFEVALPPEAAEVCTVHRRGTAGMGKDPARSVTDEFGMFHDARGLAISDASIFPGAIGTNPMDTIVALALRNADHVLENQRRLLS